MIDDVQLVNGEYGLRAVVQSAWSNDMTRRLIDSGIVELELNDGKGWGGNDLAFLAAFPHLKVFKIIDLRISSVEPIHFLHELRTLEVITYCETAIRFPAFPQLEKCSLEWRSKASSLFNCTNLKKLFLNNYDGTDLGTLSRLTRLESLTILNAPVQTLEGLRGMKLLRSLRLANLKRLRSLAGIEGLVNLKKLDIQTCRAIGSIQELGNLYRLRKLYLNDDGKIESLKPLDKLSELEEVLFYESTNIVDGDLSPLMRLKNLSKISFQNRRHYSNRREDLGVAFSRRTNGPQ
jgi:Leucine-rich repeat (LRR) protein